MTVAGADPGSSGHSVLQVPVPELESFVVARARHYDGSYVSADPDFTHAHVTVLGPWLAHPTPADLTAVADLAASTPRFDYRLEQVEAFADGIVYTPPCPSDGFETLTERVGAAFPGCPPYQGRFLVTRPHVTLDLLSEIVTIESTRRRLGAALPARCRAERLDLAWYQADACRVLHSWPLGPALR